MVKYFKSASPNPDVEDVMRDINNYINFQRGNHIGDSLTYFDLEGDFDKYIQVVDKLNRGYEIVPFRPIPFQGRFSKLKVLIKRMIRKSIGWYAADVCQQQMEVNANFARVINQQIYVMQAMMEQNKHLTKEVEELTEELHGKREIENDK